MALQGLKKLKRQMRDTIPAHVRQAVRKAMEQGAQEIVALAKSLAPYKSGALQKSIGWTWGDAPKGSIKLASVKSKNGNERITIYAGDDDAFYARWVEFGTAPHSLAKGADITRNKRQGKGVQHPGARPHPFFYVSYRQKKKRVKSRITRAANRAIKKGAS